MNYLDANFATALHFSIRGQTELAERFVRKNSAPFLFSELAHLECLRAFALRSGKHNSENWRRLVLKAGTLDTLHVAHALHSGCTRFLSFNNDSNARVLAVSCRLRVYPELTAQEQGRVVR